MVEYDPADVERRIREGEWLGTTALAVLFHRDRTTIYRWGERGVLPTVRDPVSGDLRFDPKATLELYQRFPRTIA